MNCSRPIHGRAISGAAPLVAGRDPASRCTHRAGGSRDGSPATGFDSPASRFDVQALGLGDVPLGQGLRSFEARCIMSEYVISKGNACVAKAAAKETSRYAINGVYLDPRGWAVATDGRILAAVRATPLGDDVHPCAIPSKAFAQGVSKARKGGMASIRPYADGVKIEANGSEAFSPIIEGRFPDWRDVLPLDEVQAEIQVNRKLLIALLQALPAEVVRLTVAGDNRPLCVSGQVEGESCLGVIMPCRADQGDDKYAPTWAATRHVANELDAAAVSA